MTEQLSQKIINKIKQERITPRPRWCFFLLDAWWWSLFVLSTILGTLVFTLIFKNVADNDWSIYTALGKTFSSKVFFTLPYLWLLFLALIIFLAWRELKQTRRAYRRNLSLILIGCLSLSFFAGASIYQFGVADDLEETLSVLAPQYQSYRIRSSGLWDKPEIGFLAGEIVAVADADNFLLKDVDQKVWIIEGREIVWTGLARPQVRSLVKVSGFLGDKHHFVAKTVRLWRP